VSPLIKVWGLQRTGTNLVQLLLKENFNLKVLGDEYGWKHSLPISPVEFKELDVFHLVLSRNPYTWPLACYNLFKRIPEEWTHCPRFKQRWSFEEFLQNPHYQYSNPIYRWNAFYLYWSDRAFICKLEDIQGSQTKWLEGLARGWPGVFRKKNFEGWKTWALRVEPNERITEEKYKGGLRTLKVHEKMIIRKHLDRATARELEYGY
jgi:hypothetical protein